MLRFSLTVIIIAAHMAAARADVPQLSSEISVISESGGKLRERRFLLSDKAAKTDLRLVSPHPYKNPQHLTNTWTGYELRTILRNELAKGLHRDVVVSGASGYNVLLSEDIIRKFPIILATEKDASPVTLADGGQQLVYPIGDSGFPERLKHDSWWVWFVRAIFIGTFRPVVEVASGKDLKRIDLLRYRSEIPTKGLPCYPHGEHVAIPSKGAVDIDLVPLRKLFPNLASDTKIRVENRFGKSAEVTLASNEYGLAVGWNKKKLEPTFGGPVQLYRLNHPAECLCFVSKLEVVKP